MSDEVQGAFVESLKRNNTKIRADRAEAISEDTQLLYKRTVEDLQIQISKYKREQNNMLDLSPKDATSLMLASDFDSAAYVQKDIELGIKLRNAQIRLEVATERYNHLFGEL